MTDKTDPRKTALFVLNILDKGHKTLDKILEDVLDQESHFAKKDRALLQALVYGVLRWRGKIDWIIRHFSKTPLNKIDPRVFNILRLGIFQIIYLSKIPDFAAVNTSVEIAKTFGRPWVVQFVNGILRNVTRGYKKVPCPDLDKNPAYALAVTNSFPEWLIKKWLERFGLQETEALCNAINTIPPITVRTNTLRTTREKLMKSLKGDVAKIEQTNYTPDGICFFNPKTSIPELKAFEDGWFQVQDEAAQLVTCLLNPQPGEIVLDACAGLGGKTGHIAQMMKNSGKLFATDNDEKRLLRLEQEMQRLGVSIVTTFSHNLNNPLNKFPANLPFIMFDRILLDAPCSGLGVLRRNPDIKWTISKRKLALYNKSQIIFLDNLAHLVKPAGVLVYAVCSMEPEENEEVVKGFLNKNPEFVIVNNVMGLPLKAHSLVNKNGHLRTFPHLNNMDGFFSISFKRIK